MAMSTTNGARIVHRSPGRLRVRVIDLRENTERAGEIVERLSALQGVTRIETKAETGSVLVLFDRDAFDEERFIQAAREAELFSVSADPPMETSPEEEGSGRRRRARGAVAPEGGSRGQAVYGAWERGNSTVAWATGGLLDLGTLIPLAMVLWAVRQIVLERPLARTPWYTLLWYAFGVFTRFNQAPRR
jgi:hypothetical protein